MVACGYLESATASNHTATEEKQMRGMQLMLTLALVGAVITTGMTTAAALPADDETKGAAEMTRR